MTDLVQNQETVVNKPNSTKVNEANSSSLSEYTIKQQNEAVILRQVIAESLTRDAIEKIVRDINEPQYLPCDRGSSFSSPCDWLEDTENVFGTLIMKYESALTGKEVGSWGSDSEYAKTIKDAIQGIPEIREAVIHRMIMAIDAEESHVQSRLLQYFPELALKVLDLHPLELTPERKEHIIETIGNYGDKPYIAAVERSAESVAAAVGGLNYNKTLIYSDPEIREIIGQKLEELSGKKFRFAFDGLCCLLELTKEDVASFPKVVKNLEKAAKGYAKQHKSGESEKAAFYVYEIAGIASPETVNFFVEHAIKYPSKVTLDYVIALTSAEERKENPSCLLAFTRALNTLGDDELEKRTLYCKFYETNPNFAEDLDTIYETRLINDEEYQNKLSELTGITPEDFQTKYEELKSRFSAELEECHLGDVQRVLSKKSDIDYTPDQLERLIRLTSSAEREGNFEMEKLLIRAMFANEIMTIRYESDRSFNKMYQVYRFYNDDDPRQLSVAEFERKYNELEWRTINKLFTKHLDVLCEIRDDVPSYYMSESKKNAFLNRLYLIIEKAERL